ncbi:hypothetical protein FNT36_18570 [Hymenobacter setariae]|uniref:DUF5675 domain-containing protein n=1 Tax=Hymenobacter setariae TaxID=2594794 RepID=A0A558BSY1_9BACT|nr:DUF5675 family protein [Hymenobacter setariae]TVT39646.1 hypothetical protein FNT36_18570 [Hymenobacter setariae]
MVISIIRQPSAKGATLSTWYIEGQKVCVGIEDVVRGPREAKVYGKTAIPAGTYRVLVTMSNRFKRRLPLLVNVPGGTIRFGNNLIDNCGVRIHPGNTAADTEGCLLPGSAFGADGASVSASRVAFDRLFLRIETAVANGEPITLTIK